LEEGFNVFVEKPLAITLEECGEIVKLVGKSGRKLMVGHCLRFLEAIQKMKENLDRGLLEGLRLLRLRKLLMDHLSIHGRQLLFRSGGLTLGSLAVGLSLTLAIT
jgi:predicted dehydrogenase